MTSEEMPRMEVATPKDQVFIDALRGREAVRDRIHEEIPPTDPVRRSLDDVMDRLLRAIVIHMDKNENLDNFDFNLDKRPDGSKVTGAEALAQVMKREGDFRTVLDGLPDGVDMLNFDKTAITGLWLETTQYKATFGTRDAYRLVGEQIARGPVNPSPPVR